MSSPMLGSNSLSVVGLAVRRMAYSWYRNAIVSIVQGDGVSVCVCALLQQQQQQQAWSGNASRLLNMKICIHQIVWWIKSPVGEHQMYCGQPCQVCYGSWHWHHTTAAAPPHCQVCFVSGMQQTYSLQIVGTSSSKKKHVEVLCFHASDIQYVHLW